MTTLQAKPNSLAHRTTAKTEKKLTYSSGALFQGDKSIIIEHHGDQYFLQITKSSKLILTK